MAKIYKILLVFFALFTLPEVANGANLYLSPNSGSFGVDENFTVSVMVNSDQSINAASGVLNFPTQYLQVVSLSRVNSIMNLWVQNPSFSNAGDIGNIRFEGIKLNPGFVGLGGQIIDIVFRVRKIGFATINFAESSILANDGLGTNITVFPTPASYVFTESKASPQETTDFNLNKRVGDLENTIGKVSEDKIAAIQESEISNSILTIWDILPSWVQINVLILTGIATLLVSLAFFILVIIILIWVWNYIWHQKAKIKKFLKRLKNLFWVWSKEAEGDITYSSQQLEKEFKYAQGNHSLKSVLKKYWSGLIQIINRFFTKNN